MPGLHVNSSFPQQARSANDPTPTHLWSALTEVKHTTRLSNESVQSVGRVDSITGCVCIYIFSFYLQACPSASSRSLLSSCSVVSPALRERWDRRDGLPVSKTGETYVVHHYRCVSHVLWAQIGSTRLESDVKRTQCRAGPHNYGMHLCILQRTAWTSTSYIWFIAWRDDGKRDCSRWPLPTGTLVAEVINEWLSW